jgi:hypothetical protein
MGSIMTEILNVTFLGNVQPKKLKLIFLHLLGTQLTYNQPWIYSSNVPEDLGSDLPHLAAAARNMRVRVAPWHHLQEITSLAGQTFYSFAKAVKFNKGKLNEQMLEMPVVFNLSVFNKKVFMADY